MSNIKFTKSFIEWGAMIGVIVGGSAGTAYFKAAHRIVQLRPAEAAIETMIYGMVGAAAGVGIGVVMAVVVKVVVQIIRCRKENEEKGDGGS